MRLVRALLVCAVVVVAGCGDDADDDTAAAGSTSTDSSASTSAPAAEEGGGAAGEGAVEIADFAFAPEALEVAAGSTVVFTNGDEFAHTAEADDGAFDTGELAGGASSEPVVLDEAGEYAYHCAIHEYMTGTITVTG